MIRQIIIIFFLLPVISFSQTDELLNKSRLNLRLNTGLNVSKYKNDSIFYNSGAQPFIGTSLSFNLLQRLNINAKADYSIRRSSSIRPKTTIENQYWDLTFSPSFKLFPDLYFHAGLSYYSIIISNEIINNGDNWHGIEKKEIKAFNSEINVVTGIELKLQDNINITFNYTIPTNKVNTSNFQIGLSIALNNRIDKKTSYKIKRIEASKEQIKQLKTSVLLVRLKSYDNSINSLLKVGDNEKAYELKYLQETENTKVVNAFNNHFDFCEVRYFYSNNSSKIKQKQFNGIILNDKLQVDNLLELDTSTTFFIAEFGYIEQDTIKFFSHYSFEPLKKGGLEKVKNYYSPSSDINFYALKLLDNNFVQLNKPFPYYTRAIYKTIRTHPEQLLFISTTYLAFLTWSHEATVLRMNRKLKRFYEKTNKN